MKIRCDNRDCCLPPSCEHELTSPFSSEAPDVDHYFCYSSYHDMIEPGAGRNWDADLCEAACCEVIFGPLYCAKDTQEECEDCLTKSQTTCGDPPQGVIVDADCNRVGTVCNSEQTCVVSCPDGTQFSATVAAGTFCGTDLEEENRKAYELACALAWQKVLCIDFDGGCFCVGQPVSLPVTIYPSAEGVTVELVGNPPPGLYVEGSSVVGTPTTPGEYRFDVIARDTRGNTDAVTAEITIVEIATDSPLDDGTEGEDYAIQLAGLGASGAGYHWTLESGSLPPGLTLDSDTGIISGTATTPGDYSFTIGMDCGVAVEAGPYACFPLDELTGATTIIETISGYNLSLIDGEPFMSTPGKLNGALCLGTGLPGGYDFHYTNGANSHWAFPNSFTVRFWIKPATTFGNRALFSGTPGWIVSWIGASNGVQFEVDTNPGPSSSITTGPLTLGVWHHIVFWINNGAEMGCQVDHGTPVVVAVSDLIRVYSNSTFRIDSSIYFGNRFAIDDISIWRGVLSAPEITTDWNEGTGVSCYPASTPEPIRWFYWTMEEASPNDRVDSVNGVRLPESYYSGVPGIQSIAGDPALYGNGVHIYKLGAPTGYSQLALGGNSLSALNNSGRGFSLCFWIKVVAWPTPTGPGDGGGTEVSYGSDSTYSAAGVGGALQMGYTNFHVPWAQVVVYAPGAAENLTISPLFTEGEWHFFHIFHDATLGKMGYTMDNGDPIYASFSPIPCCMNQGVVFINAQQPTDALIDFTVDEVALRVDTMFTPAQIAYLWNGGGGRTWPIVLP